MSAHSQHLIISTGRSDWSSKIEDERENGTSWGRVTSDLKRLLGRKGEFHDAFGATMISTSSFAPKPLGFGQKQGEKESDTADALLFPAFRHFGGLRPLADLPDDSTEARTDTTSLDSYSAFTGGSLKHFIPENLTPSLISGGPTDQTAFKKASATSHSWQGISITNPTILICSHGQRDSRCGILGPILHDEFRRYINEQASEFRTPGRHEFLASEAEPLGMKDATVNVGMISHIGGHKWAGNVIIYIPPGFSTSEGTSANSPSRICTHPLAGMSIWYGRVEPKHVEGIVKQTIIGGVVIKDLFRGGLDVNGKMARL